MYSIELNGVVWALDFSMFTLSKFARLNGESLDNLTTTGFTFDMLGIINLTYCAIAEAEANDLPKGFNPKMVGEWYQASPEKSGEVIRQFAKSQGVEIKDEQEEPKKGKKAKA